MPALRWSRKTLHEQLAGLRLSGCSYPREVFKNRRTQYSLDALAHRRDFEPVANLCARTVDRMWRKLQHAGRFQGHLGDAKRANMLFDIDDFFVFAEKNQIDRKEHADS